MRTKEKLHLALYPGSPADDLPLIETPGLRFRLVLNAILIEIRDRSPHTMIQGFDQTAEQVKRERVKTDSNARSIADRMNARVGDYCIRRYRACE
jgi:hypothetical protein